MTAGAPTRGVAAGKCGRGRVCSWFEAAPAWLFWGFRGVSIIFTGLPASPCSISRIVQAEHVVGHGVAAPRRRQVEDLRNLERVGLALGQQLPRHKHQDAARRGGLSIDGRHVVLARLLCVCVCVDGWLVSLLFFLFALHT